MSKLFEVFTIFLRLGLTSFGGPIAHIGFFHDEFVKKRKWLDEHGYADLVALCQFLPGPASSQVGMAVGLSRAGIPGALLAWLGFTLPSVMLLVLFSIGISSINFVSKDSVLHGLKIAAVAIVAQAILEMGKNLCPDRKRASIAILASIFVLQFPSALVQVGVIVLGGIFGWIFLRNSSALPALHSNFFVSRTTGIFHLFVFSIFLFGLPFIVGRTNSDVIRLFDGFFRAGSLVFGGGHVVLPLLQSEVVQNGWVSNDLFMAGYGAAQAIPGPLFSFSAYLGAVASVAPSTWSGAVLCLIAAFLPGYFLIVGTLPFWESFRKMSQVRFAMQGINAVVVGLLLAAFYNPVWTNAIFNSKDFCLAVLCFLFIVFWKTPSWFVVIFCAVVSRAIF